MISLFHKINLSTSITDTGLRLGFWAKIIIFSYIIMIFITLWFSTLVPDLFVRIYFIFLAIITVFSMWGLIEMKRWGYYLISIF